MPSVHLRLQLVLALSCPSCRVCFPCHPSCSLPRLRPALENGSCLYLLQRLVSEERTLPCCLIGLSMAEEGGGYTLAVNEKKHKAVLDDEP